MNGYTTPGRNHPIRVILVEDETLTRQSIKASLNAEPGIRVSGDAGTIREGLAVIQECPADVLVLDVRLRGEDGLDLLTEARPAVPGLKSLILTAYPEGDSLVRAMRKQADGFLPKSCSMEVLVDAIREVARGGKAWDPETVTRLAKHEPAAIREKSGTYSTLDRLERQMAALIAEGLTNPEIANRLRMAPKTARNRVSQILEKLGVKRRSQVASIYSRHVSPAKESA